ncbi:coxsackievirus and adenovirus receptor-like isoform 1-T1 [Symphorus nematophorus]
MVLSADILLMSLLCFLLVSVVSASAVSDQKEIKVKPGDDVTLQCQAPADAPIILLEWSRPDLNVDSYVFLYRNERSYENHQLPSFRGRVELKDAEMKNGDASVVLKNVSVNDTGTYECRVTVRSSGSNEITHLIALTVTDADDTAGNKDGRNKDGGNKDGGNKDGYLRIVIPTVIGVILVAAVCVGYVICSRRTQSKKRVWGVGRI